MGMMCDSPRRVTATSAPCAGPHGPVDWTGIKGIQISASRLIAKQSSDDAWQGTGNAWRKSPVFFCETKPIAAQLLFSEEVLTPSKAVFAFSFCTKPS